MSDDTTTEKIKKLPFITIWIAQLIVLYVGGFYVIAWYSKLISGKGLLWIFLGLLVIEEGLRHLKKRYPQEFQKMIFRSKPIVLPEKPIRLRVVGMAVLFVIFFLSLIWYLFLIAIRILPTPYAIIGFIIVAILGTFWYLLKKKYPNEYKSMSQVTTTQAPVTVEEPEKTKPVVESLASPYQDDLWKKRNKSMAIVLIIFVVLHALIIIPFSKGADLTQDYISWAIDIYIIYALFKQQNVLSLIIWRSALGFIIWGGQSLLNGNWLDFSLEFIYSAYFITLAVTKPTKLKTRILSIAVVPIYIIALVAGIIYLASLNH